MKCCVAYNTNSGMEKKWENALQKKGVDSILIDLEKVNWLERLRETMSDFVIAVPHGSISYKKQLFDEQVYVIKHILGLPIYPTIEELIVYENKRMLSYWLEAFHIPHPHTEVFFRYEEAKKSLNEIKYPIVMKSNIGAAASGVHIVENKEKALSMIKKTFKEKGLPRRRGPNMKKRNAYKNIFMRIFDFKYVKTKMNRYREIQEDRDRRSILIQEFIPHDYEWKNVRIGDSYFSHKKVVINRAASGTGKKIFVPPPKSRLMFIKDVTDLMGFTSVSVDVFEVGKDKYLVNEIQTYFGQPYSYLMAVNDKPGRYLYRKGDWTYEIGDFNTNHSCDLRLEHALKLLAEHKL